MRKIKILNPLKECMRGLNDRLFTIYVFNFVFISLIIILSCILIFQFIFWDFVGLGISLRASLLMIIYGAILLIRFK